MSFFSKIGKGLKRLARNKLVQAGLNVATGGLSGKVISTAKALGAALHGGKPMAKQNKSITAQLDKQVNPPTPVPLIEPPKVRDITPSSASRKRRSVRRADAVGLPKPTKKVKKKREKGMTKAGKPRKAPSEKQLAARAKFIAMVKAKKGK